MFDFVFWKIPKKGLLIQCLKCSSTWALTGFTSFVDLDDSEDVLITQCPTCNARVTSAIVKACIPEEIIQNDEI